MAAPGFDARFSSPFPPFFPLLIIPFRLSYEALHHVRAVAKVPGQGRPDRVTQPRPIWPGPLGTEAQFDPTTTD
jgi:hypothetical protein